MTENEPASTCSDHSIVVPATQSNIARAAHILRAGGLVAFPTETVYGLGAHALDADAVAKIYAAKERPAYNPLIVHVHDVESAQQVLAAWPAAAQVLAAQFWPGPLTLVLPKSGRVPDIISAGLPTVGVRVPAHLVAQQLLRAAKVPVAAPSANRFMQLSPTRAAHVWNALGPRVDLLLDGGASHIGIESTVLDLSQRAPVLLRPGAISRSQIESAIGPIEMAQQENNQAPRASPGMMDRHYAPRARALRFEAREAVCKYLQTEKLRNIGAILLENNRGFENARVIVLPRDAAVYARELYQSLHELDAANCEMIVIEMPPDEVQWHGVRDRIVRATERLQSS